MPEIINPPSHTEIRQELQDLVLKDPLGRWSGYGQAYETTILIQLSINQ